ncbi:hypothetical protein ACFE04_018092 [Oxalis oulophora]
MMPERNTTVTEPLNPTPLRRSSRILNLSISSKKTPSCSIKQTLTGSSIKPKSTESNNVRRKSSRLNNGVDSTPTLRRSLRFLKQGNCENKLLSNKLEGSRNGISSVTRCKELVKDTGGSRKCKGVDVTPIVRGKGKELEGFRSIDNGVEEISRVTRSQRVLRNCVNNNKPLENNILKSSSGTDNKENQCAREVSRVFSIEEDKHSSDGIVFALKAEVKVRDTTLITVSAKSEDNVNKRKRKREDDSKTSDQGWTKELELALEKAYFTAKPTPLFWKKVSKMVPGKSAKDCFEKIHADQATPILQKPRSRAKKLSSSELNDSALSASKVLLPTEAKTKKAKSHKHKGTLVHKTARDLLQKQYISNQNCQGDLFSVFEAEENPHVEANPTNATLSTPKLAKVKPKFLHNEKSSSGCNKKPLSRFSGSCLTAVVSPPVLKQVKNRALHEKYIDQLHCREAKRKTASERTKKAFAGKENRTSVCSWAVDVDVVKAAKSALASDTRDAINQLKNLQAGSPSNCSDFEDEAICTDDDEGDL